MRSRSSTSTSQALTIYSDLFQLVPSRAQRRMIQILEAAIRNYVTIGIENTTYDSIAQACGVSRPLIQHYFKDKDAVFEMTIKYIRVNFQKIAVDAIQKEKTPVGQLTQYVASLFTWIKKFPLHAKVWNLVYYYAAVNPRIRKIHTELATMGHERITALLQAGVDAGVFADGELKKRAKLIQTLYTGGLVSATAEELYVPKEVFRDSLIEGCLDIAMRGPAPTPGKPLN